MPDAAVPTVWTMAREGFQEKERARPCCCLLLKLSSLFHGGRGNFQNQACLSRKLNRQASHHKKPVVERVYRDH